LLRAIDAEPRSLRRDHTGEWHFAGKRGSIFYGSPGYRLSGEADALRRLGGFCRLTAAESHMPRMPSVVEAELIRAALSIKAKPPKPSRRHHLTGNSATRKAAGSPNNDPAVNCARTFYRKIPKTDLFTGWTAIMATLES
jgi:hypothetical protein